MENMGIMQQDQQHQVQEPLRQQKIQQWQMELGVRQGYVPNLEEHNENIDAHMRRYGIQSIHEAIQRRMPQAYEQLNAAMQEHEGMPNVLPLYERRGTWLADNQFDVLEFDMSGSTYKQFPQGHRNISGLWEYSHMEEIKDFLWFAATSVILVKGDFSNPQNRAALYMYLSAYNDRQDEIEAMKEFDEAQLDELGVRLDAVHDFHNREDLADVIRHTNIRRVIGRHERKTKYSIAGPCVLNHRGDYKTTDSRRYMLALAIDYLKGKFGEPEDRQVPERPVCIKIKGHSRGGVTASEGAMMIRRWLLDNYGREYADRVMFDIIQFDPVPGIDTFYDTAKEIDYRENGENVQEDGQFDRNGVRYAALGDSAQTTVLYSLYTEYPLAFTPQAVNGADRIIITPFKHSSGLDIEDTDRNPVVNAQGEEEHNGHRPALVDAGTQRAYRLGALNDMERGVYILDEYNILVKINSYNDFMGIVGDIYQGVNWKTELQQGRKEVILSVVENWFEREEQNAANADAVN